MADDNEHDLFMAKLARGGMEVFGMEFLRHDTGILSAHPLETSVKQLLAVPSVLDVSPELCSVWLSTVTEWETHRRLRGPFEVIPDHLEPMLTAAGKTILASFQKASEKLRNSLRAAVSGSLVVDAASPAPKAEDEKEQHARDATCKLAMMSVQGSLDVPSGSLEPVLGRSPAVQAEEEKEKRAADATGKLAMMSVQGSLEVPSGSLEPVLGGGPAVQAEEDKEDRVRDAAGKLAKMSLEGDIAAASLSEQHIPSAGMSEEERFDIAQNSSYGEVLQGQMHILAHTMGTISPKKGGHEGVIKDLLMEKSKLEEHIEESKASAETVTYPKIVAQLQTDVQDANALLKLFPDGVLPSSEETQLAYRNDVAAAVDDLQLLRDAALLHIEQKDQ